MTNEEFRAYVARICGAPKREKGPCVRGPEDAGYYPPLRDEGRSDGHGESYAERNRS